MRSVTSAALLLSLPALAESGAESAVPGLLWPLLCTGLVAVLGIVAYRYWHLQKAYGTLLAQNDSARFEQRIASEIDQCRKAKEQFLQHSRLAQMGEMVSIIAHQWRQPLGAIASTAIGIETKIRLKKFDLSHPSGIEMAETYILERLKLIAGYVDTLSTTIEDFRSFYRKDKAMEHLSSEALIEKTMGIIRGAMTYKGIDVRITIETKRELFLYPNEMVQVLLNILQNAYDQFRENHSADPCIDIDVRETWEEVEITIRDNAGGIPEAILPEIFNPYFSTKEAKNGTGIGLYMSKLIVENHHKGRLEAFNNETGACFVIHIPIQDERAAA